MKFEELIDASSPVCSGESLVIVSEVGEDGGEEIEECGAHRGWDASPADIIFGP
jgi:hypothetical protein